MIKLWWGIAWRMALMWLVFAIPAAVIYSLFGHTETTIKIKPSMGYLLMAVATLILSNSIKLGQFIWGRLVAADQTSTISKSIVALYLLAAVLNLLVAFFASTDAWVNTKMSLSFFVFVVSPLVVSFLVRLKDSSKSSEAA